MINTYAQIQSGTIINLVIADSGDYFDPTYTWVDLTGISPFPAIGWTYDGSVFTTNVPSLSLADAKSQNIKQFQSELQSFVESLYSLETRWNFLAIYNSAIIAGNLPNRIIYIAQIFPWTALCISYASSYMASINAMTDVPTVLAATWDFSNLVENDPLITAAGALAINN